MRTTVLTSVLVLVLALGGAAAGATDGAAERAFTCQGVGGTSSTTAPAGAISDNVEFVRNLREPSTAISINWIGDVMFVSTVTGVYAYDASDPADPKLCGVLPMFVWQNEAVDVDPDRKLLFVARDPRGFTSPVAPAQARFFGAVHVIDVANPNAMVQRNVIPLPAGHTTTCISAGEGPCDFLWTGGPYANELLGPYGRPIYATDIRDPLNPVQCPEPLNTGLFDGDTGYAHDVDVDEMGVAWVSSEGGVHGYWTHGEHLDPTTGAVREATPCDPVPYAGAGTPSWATPSRFMHNSQRVLDAQIPGDDGSRGMVVMATEEALSSACATSGRFATYDIRSTLDGSGFTDPAGTRMTVLDTWTPEGAEGATGCASAHYFHDRGDGLLAYAFYGQGTRFLDVSDPADVRQVGYYRPSNASTWAAYWHDGYVYVADNGRGVDILRFDDGGEPPAEQDTVTAPVLRATAAAATAARFAPDPRLGYLCALPRT